MATETIQLTTEPVQVTNGTESAYISAKNGEFRWADSDSKPTDLSSYHSEMKVSVTPPHKIWAWSPSTGVLITVSKRGVN